MQLPQRKELILGLAGFFDVSRNGLVKFAYPTQKGGPGRGTIQDRQRGMQVGLRKLTVLDCLARVSCVDLVVRRLRGARTGTTVVSLVARLPGGMGRPAKQISLPVSDPQVV